jgi:lysophospholipase L1-like esterase
VAALLLTALAGCSGDGIGSSSSGSPTPSATPSSAGDSPVASPAAEDGRPRATTRFDAVAVIGHSGATGVASDPDSPLESVNANSWATGDNPEVDSIYLRLLAEHPALEGHNYNLSANGADIVQMLGQAAALSSVDGPLPDLVLVQGIDNDMRCDGTDPANARRFARTFEQLVRTVRRGNDSVAIFVVDQWGTPDAWARAVSDVEGLVLGNTGRGPCDLFDGKGRVRPEGVEGIRRISRLYYDAMTETCRRTPRCWTDRGAASRVPVTPDLLGADYNHLSVAGHAALAEAIWAAMPRRLRQAS